MASRTFAAPPYRDHGVYLGDPVELPLRPSDPLRTPIILVERLDLLSLRLDDLRVGEVYRYGPAGGAPQLLLFALHDRGPRGGRTALDAALIDHFVARAVAGGARSAGTAYDYLGDDERGEISTAYAAWRAGRARQEPMRLVTEIRERATPDGVLRRTSEHRLPEGETRSRYVQVIGDLFAPIETDGSEAAIDELLTAADDR